MEALREGARGLGLTLSPRHLAAFELYYHELAIWNQRFNLTAISGYDEVQYKHFLDSLSCILAFPHGGSSGSVPDTVPIQLGSRTLAVVDVGSGAGFPGLPLKIILPDIRLALLEATGKKVTFLRHMVELLELKDVEVLHARAEDVGQIPEHRERYDMVVARAVSNLAVLVEYCLPLCRLGGRVVAQKGEEAGQEARTAETAISMLGGKLIEVKKVPGVLGPTILGPNPLGQIPVLSARHLIVIGKVAHTPQAYPRRPGIPSKRPLV